MNNKTTCGFKRVRDTKPIEIETKACWKTVTVGEIYEIETEFGRLKFLCVKGERLENGSIAAKFVQIKSRKKKDNHDKAKRN